MRVAFYYLRHNTKIIKQEHTIFYLIVVQVRYAAKENPVAVERGPCLFIKYKKTYYSLNIVLLAVNN